MIKAKIKSTGEVVNVRPYQTEIYDFMVCRSGGIMGELYMRSELTIIGDNELDFISLVKQMREAQEDCIFKSVFSTMGNTNTAAYSSAVTKRKTLEFKVDDMIKEMEDLK